MGRDCEIMTIFAVVLWQKPAYGRRRVHGREQHDIRKGAACALFLTFWNLANSHLRSRMKQQ